MSPNRTSTAAVEEPKRENALTKTEFVVEPGTYEINPIGVPVGYGPRHGGPVRHGVGGIRIDGSSG